ncbi:MAG: branched-chain amino acid ABC transporter permease/ATP-binding protein [Ilumatobacteraceae bacterium]
MSDVLKYLILGLGPAGFYALLAHGAVLVYRGSGVVNFAQGGFALVGGYVFYDTRDFLPAWAAALVATAAAAALGLLVQLFVMWPMRRSSPLARVIATLGILAAITQTILIIYGPNPLYVNGFLPKSAVMITDSVIVAQDRIWLFGIALGLTAVLWIVYRFTRFGLGTSAVAENQIAVAALGWSPKLVAAVNWAVGAALAGFAGVLLVPITSLSPDVLSLAIVPALSAALVGGFASFPLTFLGAALIGVLEAEALRWVSTPGWSTAVPFLVIIAMLVIRGRALPVRSFLSDRLPSVGSGRRRPPWIIVALALAASSAVLFTPKWADALTTSMIIATICLSLVVVTGYAGQISLAQYALAGVGALISSRLAVSAGLPFPLALALGVLLTIPMGLVVALPALRARGVNLAVATLGLAVVIESVVLGNPDLTGGAIGLRIPEVKVFGLDVQSVAHPDRYAIVCVLCFVGAAVVVANVRRGRAGRHLLAVRDNERAAASIGVSVVGAKVYAFGVGAGIAALGGGLAIFRNSYVEFTQFSVLQSINVVVLSVIGGIGFVFGAVTGGLIASGGIVEVILKRFFDLTQQWQLILGLFLVVQLMVVPNGIAHHQVEVIEALMHRLRRRLTRDTPTASEDGTAVSVAPKLLELRNVTVQFGGTRALSDLSLSLRPGEILGLIGPNGAGKTTLIDVATGFVRPRSGEVLLDGKSVSHLSAQRRARQGLVRSWQSLELFGVMTVEENIRSAGEAGNVWAYIRDLISPRRRPMSPAARASVRQFGLTDVLDRRPDELPYAVRRLVGIARSVALAPSVLLLDEPTAGLDEASTAELAEMIRRLSRDWGMAVLLIEHDVSMVMTTCDRVIAIDFGREVVTGSPDDVRHHPVVIESYLGAHGEAVADRVGSVAMATVQHADRETMSLASALPGSDVRDAR